MIINGYNIIKIEYGNYSVNDNIALTLICDDGVPLATITVNLGYKLLSNFAYLDTNNCSWVEDMMKEHKFGRPTGQYKESGFCEYPLYMLDFDKINEFNKGEK